MIFAGAAPEEIPYVRGYPPTRVTPRLTGYGYSNRESGIYARHNHCARVDAETGDGHTDEAAGHFHLVRNHEVMPDPGDGHKHDLLLLSCGAGG